MTWLSLTAAIVARARRDRNAGKLPCPDCGSRGPHDSNMERGEHECLCCAGCGMHFGADEAEICRQAELADDEAQAVTIRKGSRR